MTPEEAALRAGIAADPTARDRRLVYADWLRDHDRPFDAMWAAAVVEITMPELLNSYDWTEVFGEGSGGNTGTKTDACPPGAMIDTAPPKREDVAEILAAVNGENDEGHWVGVFRLKDGRFLLADAWCDYTGWDCRAGNNLEVAASLEDLYAMGLTADQKQRLGLVQG